MAEWKDSCSRGSDEEPDWIKTVTWALCGVLMGQELSRGRCESFDRVESETLA